MPLSERAQAFLAAQRRRPAVPVAQVAAAIRETGCDPYDVWLDFHERYAGYEEPLAVDTAIYGIVHTDSYWINPGKARVKRGPDGKLYVTCAEVEGRYHFRLYQNGWFCSSGAGGPCETFDVNMEQHALLWEARETGRIWTFGLHKMPAGGLDALRSMVEAEPVVEASDRFSAFWKGRDVIWFEEIVGTNRLHLWAAKDTYERIKPLLSDTG